MIRLLLIFLFVSATVSAQTKLIDSLRQVIKQPSSTKQKLENILLLAGQSIDSDTLYPYVLLADSLSASSNNKIDKSNTACVRAYYYVRKNYIDSALIIIDKLIDENKNVKQRNNFYLALLFLRSKILDRGNRYTEALTELYRVVQTAELQNDTLTTIQAKTGIGWVQMEMEQYNEALIWLNKALYTSANKKFYTNYGALYSNLASTYNALGKRDSAQHYINIAINDARNNDNLLFLATALSMQAKIFIDNKQHRLAEAPLHEVVQIRKQLNDPFYTVFDISNLASYYSTTGQWEKGIALCKEGISLAKENGLSSQLLMVYHSLAENYKAAADMVQYGQTLESIISLKDSFNNINSSKLLADMQAGSEAQKKQKEILEQKLNLTQKNYWLWGSAIVGILLISIALLAFKDYRRREKLKMEIILLEEKRNAADAVKKAEEKERVRIAADLHDNLGVYAASLSSNLSYIQPAENGDTGINAFREIKNNSNAIISELNDTIWVLKKETLSLTAISDRIKVFINRIKRSYPGINAEVKENIETDFKLPASQAFHLYRLVQEAVNNALKHSQGKNIAVKINATDNWSVIIEDDGIGMQTRHSATEGGNGLYNMRSRSEEAGWNISWLLTEGGGTSVNILPTTN